MIIKSLLLTLVTLTSLSAFSSTSDNTFESTGDGFHLIDSSYSKDESFVMTSQIDFVSGQACGVVFGSEEDNHYWVFNVDRYENKTKLLYFYKENDSLIAKELKSEYFIGNNNTTKSEFNLINPRLKENQTFYFKVVISVDNDHTYGEFYIDNIKRFGVDETIDLNDLDSSISYVGGELGFNTFSSKINVSDIEIGKSDFAYYSEPYRQQYHYSQFAHWNNDPNGLVYFNGYYHLYYQTNPYSKYWGDMYWGHARSTDLVHWEELPYVLFPDDGSLGFGDGNGYAWSGSAFVYHKGTSSTIDNLGWFKGESGLFGIYTRDGAKQDQVIITSDDGYTWTRRKLISQDIVAPGNKISCRDPKVFKIADNRYGMCISNMEGNITYFLTSTDLVTWVSAGSFNVNVPECVDVLKLDYNGVTKTVLTISGREYFVGDISYNETTNKIVFTDENGIDISTYELATGKKMDYAYDSYATQSFYIDDTSSLYYGKSVSLSWFSGVPNDPKSIDSGIFADVRSSWNGGGQTIPVIQGLAKTSDGYVLTQTPITKDNNSYSKTNILTEADIEGKTTENPIELNVNSHSFELEASFSNVKSNIEFRVNVGDDEYTAFGYDIEKGYYVDRTHTSSASLNIAYYSASYFYQPTSTSEICFYALIDNGSLELFVDNFKGAFYVLTLASPFSKGASLSLDKDTQIDTFKVNTIASIWKDSSSEDESVIYLNDDVIDLDMKLTQTRKVLAYDSLGKDLTWTIDNDIVSITKTIPGASLTATKVGSATITVSNGNKEKSINVTVNGGAPDSDLVFSITGIKSGYWYQTSSGIIGEQSSGDGFILSNTEISDFTLTTEADLGSGAAFGLVLRANEDMSTYLIANYDNNSKITKLWSNTRELGNVYVGDIDTSNIVLSVTAKENNVIVKINGEEKINVLLNDDEPLSGYLGLNVCATKATFKSISLTKHSYVFNNENLSINNTVDQYVKSIINVTNKNTKVPSLYISSNGRNIVIDKEYFKSLNENTTYTFKVIGEKDSFDFTVKIGSIENDIVFADLSINEGENINIFVNQYQVNSITVNGISLSEDNYSLSNGVLTISSSCLSVGSNEVTINDNQTFNVEVIATSSKEIKNDEQNNFNYLLVILPAIGGLILIGGIILTILLINKSKNKNRKDA